MRAWQRNRIALVLFIFIAVIIMNIATFTISQKGSLIVLSAVLLYAYIVYGNRYHKK